MLVREQEYGKTDEAYYEILMAVGLDEQIGSGYSKEFRFAAYWGGISFKPHHPTAHQNPKNISWEKGKKDRLTAAILGRLQKVCSHQY